ncbi:tetratricopeptide repeat protein [Thermaurantiacus sp.]
MKAPPLLALVVALALGATGYAAVGRPDLPARPAPKAPLDPRFTPEAERASGALLENFGDVRAWITLANALIRAGRTERAVEAMQVATDTIPGDVNLWVQKGVALVAHADGEVVPAARLAFDRASQIDPTHPAPRYFLGLAWLQAGRPREALEVWYELKAMTPPDAPWKEELDRMIGAAETMKILGVGENG